MLYFRLCSVAGLQLPLSSVEDAQDYFQSTRNAYPAVAGCLDVQPQFEHQAAMEEPGPLALAEYPLLSWPPSMSLLKPEPVSLEFFYLISHIQLNSNFGNSN